MTKTSISNRPLSKRLGLDGEGMQLTIPDFREVETTIAERHTISGRVLFPSAIVANNESYSISTVKGSIPQMKLAFQGINNHNAYDLDHDGMMDVIITPHDAEVNLSLSSPTTEAVLWIGKGNGKHPEIARLERIFKVEITGVLSGWYENGRIKSLLECRNALGNYSEMETDLSEEARYSLPFLWDGPKPKQSTWERWIGGEYPVESWLENLFAHHEAQKIAARRSKIITPEERGETSTPSKETKDVLTDGLPVSTPTTKRLMDEGTQTGEVVADEIHCAICSRQLTNPTSRRLQIGPECRKRIGFKGLLYLQDDNVVSAELMEASKLYHEEQFRKWIIRCQRISLAD